jgi:hypothetical protein
MRFVLIAERIASRERGFLVLIADYIAIGVLTVWALSWLGRVLQSSPLHSPIVPLF